MKSKVGRLKHVQGKASTQSWLLSRVECLQRAGRGKSKSRQEWGQKRGRVPNAQSHRWGREKGCHGQAQFGRTCDSIILSANDPTCPLFYIWHPYILEHRNRNLKKCTGQMAFYNLSPGDGSYTHWVGNLTHPEENVAIWSEYQIERNGSPGTLWIF
jgi:hypothetical protein